MGPKNQAWSASAQSVRGRLRRLFGLLGIALVAAAVATTLFAGESVREQERQMTVLNDLTRLVHVELDDALEDERTAFRSYLLTGKVDDVLRFEDAQHRVVRTLVQLDAAGDAELSANLARVTDAHDRWSNGLFSRVRDLRGAGFEITGALLVEGNALADQVDAAVSGLDDIILERERHLTADSRQAGERGVMMILVLLGGLGLGMAVIGVTLLRSVSRPLERLIQSVDEARRTGHATFDVSRRDEIGLLAGTLQGLHEDLAARYDAARLEAERALLFTRLSQRLATTSDESEISRAGAIVLGRLIPYASGSISLLNPSSNRLTVAATWGASQPSVGELLSSAPQGCPAIRLSTDHIVRDDGDELMERCAVVPLGPGFHQGCMPMLAMGKVVGVVHLQCPSDAEIDPAGLEHAQRVTEQLGMAISNSRLTRTLERLAMTDPLTGLGNARNFDAVFAGALSDARAAARDIGLIFLDLDHFKSFNDTYGHPAGDEALRALGTTVTSVVRDMDIVARYGGEEFVIAVRDSGLEATTAAAEKIRYAVSQMVVALGPDRFARVTASLGVAATDSHGFDAVVLLRTADAALYTAKSSGRNRVAVASASEIPDGAAEVPPAPPERRHHRARRSPALAN